MKNNQNTINEFDFKQFRRWIEMELNWLEESQINKTSIEDFVDIFMNKNELQDFHDWIFIELDEENYDEIIKECNRIIIDEFTNLLKTIQSTKWHLIWI